MFSDGTINQIIICIRIFNLYLYAVGEIVHRIIIYLIMIYIVYEAP